MAKPLVKIIKKQHKRQLIFVKNKYCQTNSMAGLESRTSSQAGASLNTDCGQSSHLKSRSGAGGCTSPRSSACTARYEQRGCRCAPPRLSWQAVAEVLRGSPGSGYRGRRALIEALTALRVNQPRGTGGNAKTASAPSVISSQLLLRTFTPASLMLI